MDSDRANIRKPAVAGAFYPADPVQLTRTIAGYFAEVEKTPLSGKPMGLVAPHAGYQYSGKTAATAFKLLEGEDFDTVVVVSPSHRVFFKGCAVFEGFGYQTPLGIVESDRDLAKKIASIHPSVYFSKMGHAGGANRGEHSLEVQLPFLQIVLGNFKLVAIVMGDQEEDSINALGEVLGSALKGANALMVASTDLSHFHSEKKANRLDGEIRKAIEKYDPELLMDTLSYGKGEACGGGPVASMMIAAKRLGGEKSKFLHYTTSGEATGDFSEVVGYLSAVIVAGKKAKNVRPEIGLPLPTPTEEFTVTDKEKEQLLTIAKESISAVLADKKYTPPEIESLKGERGAFVTIKIAGNLRGCIGQIRGFKPLNETIADMAQAAAFEDPRFPQLTQAEFDQLEFEISVLSPLKRVHNFNEIKVGRDGLMIKMDYHSGLLLPQVADEYGWDTMAFLEQTCLKAGLPKNSFKSREAEIYRFSAVVFS